MFFEEENLAVEILDVLEFYHDNVHNVGNRPFHALSYRIEADTHISTATQRFHAKGGSLMYFPKTIRGLQSAGIGAGWMHWVNASHGTQDAKISPVSSSSGLTKPGCFVASS